LIYLQKTLPYSYNFLYISYDSIQSPLGKSQILNYLNKLSDIGTFHLISFEKHSIEVNKKDEIYKKLSNNNIYWYPIELNINISYLCLFQFVVTSIILSIKIINKFKISLIHSRSYVPAFIGLILKFLFGIKFIFDMRGFWADEKVDCGNWSKFGFPYLFFKFIEKYLLINADCIISLTEKAILEIHQMPFMNGTHYYEVIRTCTDLDTYEFQSLSKRNNNITFCYLGSATNSYLFNEVLKFFKFIINKNMNFRFKIINNGEHLYIKNLISFYNIDLNYFTFLDLEHSQVPAELEDVDFGIFFIKQVFSKIASMPTKLGEFLACGVPCICNEGIGDVTNILNTKMIGIVLTDYTDNSYELAYMKIIQLIHSHEIKRNCRLAAEEFFSLDDGVNKYRKVYKHLIS